MPNVPITLPSSSTPVSGAASFCTPSQFFFWFDVRVAAQYLSDNWATYGAIAGSNPEQVDPVVVAAHPTLNAILQAASGKLEASVMVGDRYTPGDLILLTSATSNMALWIAQIVAGLAAPVLIQRRPDLTAPKLEIIQESKEILAALANGEAIFGLQEVMDAGKLEDITETLADVETRYLTSWRCRRLFGWRTKWRNPGGCG